MSVLLHNKICDQLNHLFAAASDTLENVSAESKAFKLAIAAAQKERRASIVQ